MTPAPTFRGRLWRFTKRLTLGAVLTVLTAAPVVGFGLPALSRSVWAHLRVEKALTRAFGTPVQFSAMRFSWKSGLSLQGLGADAAFHAEELTLKPRYAKLFRGQLRARAILTKPELSVVEGSAPMSIPRLARKGFRLEKLEIRDGSIVAVTGSDRRTVRLTGVSADGEGRLQDRTLKFELSHLSGDCDGLAFTGKGVVRVSQDGVAGEVDLKEAAAKDSSSLQQALRALHLTIRKAPVLSEPY